MAVSAKKKKNPKEPKVFTLDLLDSKGKVKEKVILNEKIFNGKISLALLQQAVTTYLSNKRKGLACAKTRGEKRGGGRKPWRQKGTGRARVGSIRSPLWKGGGVTFGPRPRSYYKKLPERMKAAALKSALSFKLKKGQVSLIEQLELKSSKAKDFAKIISSLGIDSQKVCFVVSELSQELKRASANFKKVLLNKASDLNALGVLECKKLVLTKESLEIVEKRLAKWIQT